MYVLYMMSAQGHEAMHSLLHGCVLADMLGAHEPAYTSKLTQSLPGTACHTSASHLDGSSQPSSPPHSGTGCFLCTALDVSDTKLLHV